METARQLIDALQNETREESVSPQRLAGIYDAILSQEESDRENLEKKIEEAAASGSTELPEDFLERVDAIGTTASSALDKAETALDMAKLAIKQIGEGQAGSSAESAQALEKANEAMQSAQTAQTTASNAKTAAETAQTTALNAKSTAETAKTAAQTAQTTASNAKTAADNAKTAVDNAIKLVESTEGALSSYSETTDARLESLEDFRALVGDVSFWTGTMQQYDSINAKDPTTIYFITE